MLAIHWFRRDLRLQDNTALFLALKGGLPVLPVFMIDSNIVDELPEDDGRLSFIYQSLEELQKQLTARGSSLLVLKGDPISLWKKLLAKQDVQAVYFNKDYEPYALQRDSQVSSLLESNGVEVRASKDQVIFEEHDVLKKDGLPYTVFTPYKRRWLELYVSAKPEPLPEPHWEGLYKGSFSFPSLQQLGFRLSSIQVRPFSLAHVPTYATTRNFPAQDKTSYLSPHLRFGTISVRQILARLEEADEVFRSELIWREFFMQILFHFPRVVHENFHVRYNGIVWRNNEEEFKQWCQGTTGYPLVDAGMRQLNQTGTMHNRVRMVTASFLCKHLLIDWKWGEAYFAKKLLDYELSSNNGNWQWAAGTGCDAAPYFRVFSPAEQLRKFDKGLYYVRRWVPEYGSDDYPVPMVEHTYARERALTAYKAGLGLAQRASAE